MIRHQVVFFAKVIVFYALLFAVWRLFFLAINLSPDQYTFSNLLSLFSNGLRIDLSAIGYLLIPVILLAVVSLFTTRDLVSRMQVYYHRVIVVVVSLVLLGNVIIYHFWGTMLNYRALTYLADPKEAVASVTGLQLSGLIAVLGITVFVSLYYQRKWMPAKFPVHQAKRADSFLGLLVISMLLSLCVRGGWQQLPMNESLVYFSNQPVLNSAAVNPVWHLTYDTRMALTETRNPFNTLPDSRAGAYVAALQVSEHVSSPSILRSTQPNIVVILLESFTADIIRSLGGENDVTPVIDSLIQQGFLFEHIYSSGFRTDQGIVSVINGWPATPYHSIMRAVEKSRQLPSLCRVLSSKGYQTSFYYGGESNFSNLKSFVLDQGFQSVVDEAAFGDSISRGQWGVHDEDVLQRNAVDLSAVRQPFFSVVVTLSNHEPFDVPGKKRFPGNDASSLFRNAAAYTDASLGLYFDRVSRQPWYKNTLFVLVADHAHELPKHRNVLYPEGRHIPLLFFGPVLADSVRGQRCTTYGGHHDLAKTLLRQCNSTAEEFSWSKDLLDSNTASFAYLPHENYLLWTNPDGWFIWMFDRGTITERSKGYAINDNDPEALRARSFMQAHYEAYLKY